MLQYLKRPLGNSFKKRAKFGLTPKTVWDSFDILKALFTFHNGGIGDFFGGGGGQSAVLIFKNLQFVLIWE